MGISPFPKLICLFLLLWAWRHPPNRFFWPHQEQQELPRFLRELEPSRSVLTWKAQRNQSHHRPKQHGEKPTALGRPPPPSGCRLTCAWALYLMPAAVGPRSMVRAAGAAGSGRHGSGAALLGSARLAAARHGAQPLLSAGTGRRKHPVGPPGATVTGVRGKTKENTIPGPTASPKETFLPCALSKWNQKNPTFTKRSHSTVSRRAR